ncbi:MAG: choice-of-anchor D domain-containing protein [Nitrospirae bacterium]|nr:choice-of-anchor D domain-containing protein [Nitrospirota bacterium]
MPDYVRLQSISSKLQAPSGVALDAYDNLYVTDSKSNKLVIYGSDGTYIDTIHGFSEPISVAVGNGSIYVGDSSGTIKVYDKNRNYINSFGNFLKPASIALDAAGNIYVVDSERDVVYVYNADGTFNFSFGGSGNTNGLFHYPTSIAINALAGEIIVTDLQVISSSAGTYEGARIQVFDMSGHYMRSFGDYGIGANKLFRPSGVAVDEEGRVYVTDVFQNVVQVYNNDGTHLGALYDSANPMRTPVDITISNSNKIYVASFYTYGVEVYRITDNRPAYATVVPQSHDFGNTYVGSSSVTQKFTVYNIGNGDLQLGSVVIAGADVEDFIVQADSCNGSNLAPADTCEVIVAMSPVSVALKSAEINIYSNDPSSPLVVALSGDGVAAPNQSPVADAGGPYNVNEGTTSLLDASGSSDADGSIVSYAWDLDNDGVYETIGNPMGFDAASIDGPLGPFTIGLKVTDNLGAIGTTTTTIMINNVPPVADAGGPYSAVAGTAVLLSGSAVDSGNTDVLNYAWDLDGDGIYETSGNGAQITYDAVGNYAVGLRVTDDDGGVGIDTAQIIVTAAEVEVPGIDVSLNAGWNLVGWISDVGYYKAGSQPDQGEYASGAAMNSVENIDAAMTDIGLSSTDYLLLIGPEGKVHIPGSPFNTLKKLLPDRAYWIYANQDIVITLPGEKLSKAATSTLTAGWVQVGYRGDEGLNPADALRCIDGNYNIVVSGKGKLFIKGFPYNNLNSLHQGQGYFMYMTTTGTLTYDCP